ncbi:hypothetical protein BC834DRAFT_40500 [Gloeopeniophorella convolvens]|nr:hypothetical protein BC834DRAFT_40500 [Gloeopeniophorella convolvens]
MYPTCTHNLQWQRAPTAQVLDFLALLFCLVPLSLPGGGRDPSASRVWLLGRGAIRRGTRGGRYARPTSPKWCKWVDWHRLARWSLDCKGHVEQHLYHLREARELCTAAWLVKSLECDARARPPWAPLGAQPMSSHVFSSWL